MEQIYLDGLMFARPVLNGLFMQFWTHSISFNIDLWFKSHGKKCSKLSVENWHSSLNALNEPY